MMSLTNLEGWRLAVLVAALAVGALILPVLALMRDRPEALGLRAYGDSQVESPAAPSDNEQPVPLAQALRTRDFWLLAGSFFVCGYTTNGLIGTHLLPHAIEHGFSSMAAANALGLMGTMNIIGTLASGRLSDRYDNRVLLAIYYSLRAIAIAFLPFVADTGGLSLFAIVYGLDWIATVPPTINLTAQRFGRASVGTLYGWIFFAHMLGASVAAYLGGALHDALGDYTLAFFSAALLGLVAAGFSMGVRRMQFAPAPTSS
jgi:predicted MFS family arabinose efflux permease